MKKQITLFGFSILLVSAVALMASSQQANNNKDKGQQQGKGNNKEKQGKPTGNPADAKYKNPQPGNSGKNNNDKRTDQANNGKNQNNGNNNFDDKGKKDNKNDGDNGNNGKGYAENGYSWNRENFKDRQKLKKQEKVTICHKFNSANEPGVSITVSANAVKAHMNHGDIMGDCPAVAGGRFSDIFLRNRTDYYNNLQNTQEQVYYSRSILDYAVARLAGSRTQLATMQNNNLPLADIQRKQATVVELEQNVSLLETVLGVAANYVVNKL
jgi:hypothetical protein